MLAIIAYTLLVLFSFLLLLAFLLRQPFVQHYVGSKLTEKVAEQTHTRLGFKTLKVELFTGVTARDLYLRDTTGETMLRVGRLHARPEMLELLRGNFRFRSVRMDSVDFFLINPRGQHDYTFIRFINALTASTDTTPSTTPHVPFRLRINNINMQHVHFRLKDENVNDSVGPHTIDFSNLNVYDATIKAKQFSLTDDSIHLQLNELKGKEQSGFVIKNLSTDLTLGPRWFVFKNLKAETNHSTLQADYTMQTSSWDTYSDYIDSVMMTVRLGPSVLDMSDLGYFSGIMFNMPDVLHINGGKAHGTVASLKATHLDVQYGKDTHFTGTVYMTGLPDFYASYIHAKIQRLTTSAADVRSFAYPGDTVNYIPLPSLIGTFDPLTLSGSFKGYYEDFTSDLKVQPKQGGPLQMKLDLKSHNNHFSRMALEVKADSFPLNEVLNTNGMLGNTSLDGNIRMGDVPGQGANNIHLNIQHLNFNGYDYHNIRYTGNLKNDTLRNHLSVVDKYLGMKLTGTVVLGEQPDYNFRLSLGHSDFTELNWWNEKDFHLKTQATIRFTGNNLAELAGSVKLKKTVMRFGSQNYPVKNIVLTKTRKMHQESVALQSDFLNFDMTGDYRVAELGKVMPRLLHHFYTSVQVDTSVRQYQSNNLHFKLTLLKPALIGEQFVQGLSISPDTWVDGHIDFKHPSITASGYARDITYQGVELQHNDFRAGTDQRALKMDYSINHLILKDSTKNDKSVFGMDSLNMHVGLQQDTLLFGMRWDNQITSWKNNGRINGYFVDTDSAQQLRVTRSQVYVNDTLWHLDDRNELVRQNGSWHFRHFRINGGLSQLMFQGAVPEQPGDSLEMTFRRWNLSNLNLLWEYFGFNLNGMLNGYINLSRRGEKVSPVANLTVDGLTLNRSYLGTAYVLSTWDNINNSAFIKSQVIKKESSSKARKVFGLEGFYYPYRNHNQFDLTANFNGMRLLGANRFLREYISHLKGSATGKIHLSGNMKEPELRGAVSLDSVSLVVNYLNTKYSFYHNKFVINKNYLDFGKFILYDTLGNHGVLQGKVLYHYFRDARLDVHLTTDRLLFFNTTQRASEVYYGTAIAGGRVDITGPLDNINLNLNVQSEKGTSVVLPLDYSSEISDKDFIIFKNPADSTKNKEKKTVLNLPPERQSQYHINLNMGIRPSANLRIYLPSGMGSIESQGEGSLNLKLNSAGDVSLAGDYVVDQGSLDFRLADFVRKHLELVKGGRISWSGDPYKATVNIKGLYKVKADLSTLGVMIDSSASFKNRVNVDCYVVLSHELFNPEISFQIKFPDMDPDMQRMIYAQLDTTNQALMNQEMISLLVLGSFSLSNAMKVNLASSYYKILSNQLSGLLSRISKDFDVGLNYKPGDNISKEEFDVALSTQLFDNRLMINGNFGMSYDRQSRQASNLVGDVDIGYKLTKDGRWLLKVYNHSNVNSWYYYSNYDKISPYTQGVGIAYRKSFDNIHELFGKKKKPKKQQQKKNRKATEVKNKSK